MSIALKYCLIIVGLNGGTNALANDVFPKSETSSSARAILHAFCVVLTTFFS